MASSNLNYTDGNNPHSNYPILNAVQTNGSL